MEPASKPTDGDGSEEELPFVVLCPMCSEPFVPDFPSRCKHCGCSWGDETTDNEQTNTDRLDRADDSENNDPTRLNNLQLAVILILAIVSIFILAIVRIFVLQIGF